MPDKTAKTPLLGLYDLSNDIGEAHNLAAAHPERVKQLQSDWAAWRKSMLGDTPAADVKPKAAYDSP